MREVLQKNDELRFCFVNMPDSTFLLHTSRSLTVKYIPVQDKLCKIYASVKFTVRQMLVRTAILFKSYRCFKAFRIMSIGLF